MVNADADIEVVVDHIQYRYGWTDDAVRVLPLSRFLRIAERCEREWDDERKREMIVSAHISWQIVGQLGGLGSDPPSFPEYLRRLGIEII